MVFSNIYSIFLYSLCKLSSTQCLNIKKEKWRSRLKTKVLLRNTHQLSLYSLFQTKYDKLITNQKLLWLSYLTHPRKSSKSKQIHTITYTQVNTQLNARNFPCAYTSDEYTLINFYLICTVLFEWEQSKNGCTVT